ncbi:hypothetical protein ABHF54_05645 [Nitrosomonas europaea]|uniref:hypothetical protein n=1 Tax=Nitrosomonas europaea TaxID=915 RepID=UPI0032661F7D
MMRVKLFLAVVLSLSVSCFAGSGGDQPESLPETGQTKNTSTGDEQPTRIETGKKEAESQSSQETGLDKQSLMIDYCRKHTC